MNTTKNLDKIFSKLPVELNSIKVELGIADDIESEIKSFDDEYKKLDNLMDAYYNKIFSLQKEFAPISKMYTEFDSTIKTLKKNNDAYAKAAKELGVKQNELPLYKKAEAALKRADNMVAEFFEANAISKKINQSI
jgi:predicted  nucleic acid-binding Zn-ribbon protein